MYFGRASLDCVCSYYGNGASVYYVCTHGSIDIFLGQLLDCEVVISSDLGGAARQRVYTHAMFDAALSVASIACLSQSDWHESCSHGGFRMPLSVLADPFVPLMKATCGSAIWTITGCDEYGKLGSGS
ncbi:hypothetical protein Tco_0018497 [Tanacetum coccineum]